MVAVRKCLEGLTEWHVPGQVATRRGSAPAHYTRLEGLPTRLCSRGERGRPEKCASGLRGGRPHLPGGHARVARPGLSGNPKRFSSSPQKRKKLVLASSPEVCKGTTRPLSRQRAAGQIWPEPPHGNHKTLVIESPGPRTAQRAIHVLHASPDQKARSTRDSKASVSPVARALL